MTQRIALDTPARRALAGGLDKRIERLTEQVGALMDEHNRLVKAGKIPAYKLMGLHTGYRGGVLSGTSRN